LRKKGCIVGVAATVLVTVGFTLALANYNRDRAFSPEGWREANYHSRGTMVLDLVRGGRLQGLNHAQVLEVLGPPDWGDDASTNYKYTAQSHPFLPFSDWPEFLAVNFNADGRVVNVSQDD
jgi:hypothetical protein